MSAATPRRPALLRGGAVGALTAALALAAHGAASGVFLADAAYGHLLILAAAAGATAATSGGRLWTLLTVLATGQVLGHQLLAVDGHPHGQVNPAAMLAAHAAAILTGAVLIWAGERLCAILTRAVRAIARPVSLPVPPATPMYRAEGQPLHSAALLRASISHRGPPVPA